MTDTIDLAAYLARIGFSGTPAPDLATLSAIQALHPLAIAFESLDPLLGRPVSLDLADLQAKIVSGRRGGYCFEKNALFVAALEQIGFKVQRLAGRVRWNMPPETPPTPRSHMLLKVELPEGPFIADVAFGGQVHTAPLRLAPGEAQVTSHGQFRIVTFEDGYQMEALAGEDWRAAYRFNLEPAMKADYETANWYTSTHPRSIFRNNLILAIVDKTARHTVLNRVYTRWDVAGGQETRPLETPADLAALLDGVFGIEPPAPVAEIFERLAV